MWSLLVVILWDMLMLSFFREHLKQGTAVINGLAHTMGQEVKTQEKHIDRIMSKTDEVDDKVAQITRRVELITT